MIQLFGKQPQKERKRKKIQLIGKFFGGIF